MLIAIGSLLLAVTGVFGLVIVINAFKESAGQGLLCMFVPLYIFYYAFARYRSPKKGVVVGGWLGTAAIGTTLIVVGLGQAAVETAHALDDIAAGRANFNVGAEPAAGGGGAAARPGRVMSCNLATQPAHLCSEYHLGDIVDEASAREQCDSIQVVTPAAQRARLTEGACPTADAIGKCEQRLGGTVNVYYRDPSPDIDNNQAMTAMEQICMGTFTRLGG